MSLGIKVRLSRLFSHPSGNIFGGTIEHFVGYGDDRISELIASPEEVVRAGADALAVDVMKVGYTGEFESFKETINSYPVPIVIAGYPKQETLLGALKQTSEVLRAGARGAVVGRNLWGHGEPTTAAKAFKGIIHDGLSVEEALKRVEI